MTNIKQKYNTLSVTEQKGTQSEESEIQCSASWRKKINQCLITNNCTTDVFNI